MRQTDHRHLRDCWKISMTHRKEQQCVTAVMAGSGSLGTFLCPSKGRIGYHSPQGEAKEQAGCFIWHPPDYWARQDKCVSTPAAFWFWPPVPGSTHLLLIGGCGCKSLVHWLEPCSKPPPTACTCQEQPLGSGSCSQCLRACSQKSFLPDSCHPLAIISHSSAHSQTLWDVCSPLQWYLLVLGVTSRTDTDTQPSLQPGVCSVPTLTHPAQESMTEPPEPFHICTKHRHSPGHSWQHCQQYLMSLCPHTSPLEKNSAKTWDTHHAQNHVCLCWQSCTDPLLSVGFYCPYPYQSHALQEVVTLLIQMFICCSDQGFKIKVCQSIYGPGSHPNYTHLLPLH